METSNKKAVSNTKVVTGVVMLSYAHVYEPHKANDNDEAKYSASIIIPKSDTETIAKIKRAIAAATEDGKTSKWKGRIPSGLHNPLRDGDEDRPEDESYKDSYFFNCSSKQQPQMVDLQRQDLIEPGALYSGCYVRVSVNFFPYDNSGSKGIAVGLNAIQKVKDGTPLGGGTNAKEDFDDGFGDDLGDDDDIMG